MAMPNGWRISAPSPVPSASGIAPSSAAMVVIMMGRKRSRHAWKIASRVLRPSWRSATMAKSIIMMAFFLTMPINNITPIMAMMLNSALNHISASSAPTPAEGRVESMVIGCMVLSYRMPSTIYTVINAASIRNGWLDNES